MKPSRDIQRLIEVMAALRHPVSGCPWDVEQTFQTIAPYTLEEAYEVVDAIERGDMDDLAEELGDLLLQVVYHARMAEEREAFGFGDVVEHVTAKMIRRHPHVFGDEAERERGMTDGLWDRIKAEEKAERGKNPTPTAGLLDAVPGALPGLAQALKLQKQASRVGFDWNNASTVMDKLREETAEIEEAIASNPAAEDKLTEEIGDLLFTVVNLARHLGVDPDRALRQTNGKFRRRFAAMEAAVDEPGRLGSLTLEELEALWQAAKTAERD